jgi:hypothetical protein
VQSGHRLVRVVDRCRQKEPAFSAANPALRHQARPRGPAWRECSRPHPGPAYAHRGTTAPGLRRRYMTLSAAPPATIRPPLRRRPAIAELGLSARTARSAPSFPMLSFHRTAGQVMLLSPSIPPCRWCLNGGRLVPWGGRRFLSEQCLAHRWPPRGKLTVSQSQCPDMSAKYLSAVDAATSAAARFRMVRCDSIWSPCAYGQTGC